MKNAGDKAADPLSSDAVRLDKWLWAVRLFKTRQLAIDAINAGRVHVNQARVKPAKTIKIGVQIVVRKPPYEWSMLVQGLAEKRGAAKVAATQYTESAESVVAREALRREQQEMPPQLFPGRPTKKDRRVIDKFIAYHQAHDET